MSAFERLRAKIGRSTERQRFGALFAFAFAVRLIYLHEIQGSLFFDTLLGDASTYDAWATQLKDDWVGTQVFFQAPLYPYFLGCIYAVFGHDLWLVRVVQMALGSASCVLLAAAGRAFFTRNVGYVSGLVLAVYAPALFFDGLVQKATLDLFLTTSLLFFLGKIEGAGGRRFFVLAGAALGALALTRENALIWLPCLLGWLLWRAPRSEWRQAARQQLAPFALGVALILAPVVARNFAVGGEFFLTTSQFGQNFYIGNHAHADGTYQSLRFGHGGARFERQDAIDLAEAAAGHSLSPAEVSHYWASRAWSFIEESPGEWLALLTKKWFLVWNARELPDSDEPLVYADQAPLFAALSHLVSFASVCPLSFAGAVLAFRERRRTRILHVLMVSLAASTALFFVFARYRYPLLPMLILFAVFGIFRAREALRARQFSLLVRLVAVVVAGIVIGHLDIAPAESPRATAYYDLGVSLEQLERPSDAKASYLQALSANPEFVEAHVNLGSLLARSGDFEPAAFHERSALRLKPDDAVAHANLGNILLEQGKDEEARFHYGEALRLDPAQAEAREGLAILKEKNSKTTP